MRCVVTIILNLKVFEQYLMFYFNCWKLEKNRTDLNAVFGRKFVTSFLVCLSSKPFDKCWDDDQGVVLLFLLIWKYFNSI